MKWNYSNKFIFCFRHTKVLELPNQGLFYHIECSSSMDRVFFFKHPYRAPVLFVVFIAMTVWFRHLFPAFCRMHSDSPPENLADLVLFQVWECIMCITFFEIHPDRNDWVIVLSHSFCSQTFLVLELCESRNNRQLPCLLSCMCSNSVKARVL